MRRTGSIVAAAACLVATCLVGAPRARAAGAVFAGDPVDPGGTPYEILPGLPLLTAGADGRLGTADDVVTPGLIGDVDLAVRLGPVPAGPDIPHAALARNGVATGVAGLRGAGVAIPFHVYLSDGAVSSTAPYGHRLAAADMVGLPVIVMLFADRNGDGVIGPIGRDPRRDVRALAELEAVGSEVALFDAAGYATGTIMPVAGGPSSRGGVTLLATAVAFTGGYDPQVLDGVVPIGPAITTAQPFVPERDPARIFTDVGPLRVDGTLNPRIRAAAIPDPAGGLALAQSVRKPGPTVDTARAVAGPAVCARVMEPGRGRGLALEPPALAFGTAGTAGRVKLAVVAVDRLGNPTDPAPGMTARVVTDAPLAITPNEDGAPASETRTIALAKGAKITLTAAGPGSGTLRVTVGSAICQELPVSLRRERNRGGSDALVAAKGRADFRSLAAAAAGATDDDGDGRITIAIADGIFRDTVLLDRNVELIGAGTGRTVVDARGLGATVTIAASGAAVAGLTASGGTAGFAVAVPTTVAGLEARGNVGAGIRLDVGGAAATACVARENGGAGFALAAPASVTANLALDNAGAGISAVASAVTIADNVVTTNGGEGVVVLGGADPAITGNAIAGNYGGGIELEEVSGGTVTGNRGAGNDGDGLSLNQSDGALVDGNDFSRNHGYGMRIDRATADFAAVPGTQAPPGSNDVGDNRKGAIDFR